MNHARMLQLADRIEQDKSFDMSNWSHCAAGNACGLFGTREDIDYISEKVSIADADTDFNLGALGVCLVKTPRSAMHHLDLTLPQAQFLFLGKFSEKKEDDLDEVTAGEVASAVRQMVYNDPVWAEANELIQREKEAVLSVYHEVVHGGAR